jgi:hypothetical protein
LGVHRGTIGRLLGRRQVGHDSGGRLDLDGEAGPEHGEAEASPSGQDQSVSTMSSGEGSDPGAEEPGTTTAQVVLPRLEEGERPSRYAGAMLLHAFLGRVGVGDVLSGVPADAARRYDASALVLCSTFGFALGISSLEGAKHLRVADAGALVGLSSFPHLRTLRPRLKSLASACDPLSIQRGFATAMLAADERPPELFYVDDHFVTYWGARPVAKGYNIRRHLAEPGRADTFVVDDRWRAVCFASGEPKGLSVSMPEVIAQLRQITGSRPVMVGFDRGGSYPKVFAALAAQGMEWVTWRRAPLAVPTAPPRRSWMLNNGKRHYLSIADELVELDGYDHGPIRQLSAFEHGKVAFQVLTSNTSFRPAPILHKLRHRWCIENFNKYVEDHHGVHWLASYDMDTEPDTNPVPNPARKTARAKVTAAKTSLAEAQRALGRQRSSTLTNVDEHLTALSTRRDHLAIAQDNLDEAKADLKGVPAKLPANQINPNAKRAKPALAARALQMVCRLLAYNAELDLARRLNTYLTDDNEYRSITRHLLHLAGRITYHPQRIVVTLDQPDSPRIATALRLLLEEINNGPPIHLTGDHRPISYTITQP